MELKFILNFNILHISANFIIFKHIKILVNVSFYLQYLKNLHIKFSCALLKETQRKIKTSFHKIPGTPTSTNFHWISLNSHRKNRRKNRLEVWGQGHNYGKLKKQLAGKNNK